MSREKLDRALEIVDEINKLNGLKKELEEIVEKDLNEDEMEELNDHEICYQLDDLRS